MCLKTSSSSAKIQCDALRVYSSLSLSGATKISTLSHYMYRLQKNITENRICVLNRSAKLSIDVLILKIIESHFIINVHFSHMMGFPELINISNKCFNTCLSANLPIFSKHFNTSNTSRYIGQYIHDV